MSPIIAVIIALPQILSEFRKMAAFIKDVFGDNYEKFIVDNAAAMREVKDAKNETQRLEAARKIRSLIGRL